MLFQCVEPAHDNVGDDYYGWHFTIRPGLGHTIVFPHVDSCLGVACLLNNGHIFAGHINGFFGGGMNYDGAMQNLTNQINLPVNAAIAFGDIRMWDMILTTPMQTSLNTANLLKVICDSSANGVDTFVDVDNGDVRVMGYLQNRDFKRDASNPKHNARLGNVAGVGQVVV